MKRLLFLTLAAAAPLIGCAPAAPMLRASADEIGPLPDNYSEAVIPDGGTIVLQGDDTIYGDVRHGGRSPINGADTKRGALTLADVLNRSVHHVTVVDHGFPGDTVAKSAERWAGHPVGNLLILSYGYGDYRAQTDVADFTAALTKMVQQAQAQGSAVFIITTPPATSKKLADLDLYRTAAQDVGAKQGVDVFNSSVALTSAKASATKDGLGSAAIYRAIAGAMIPYIQVVPQPGSAPKASAQTSAPQTGQAGSGGTPTVRVSAESAS